MPADANNQVSMLGVNDFAPVSPQFVELQLVGLSQELPQIDPLPNDPANPTIEFLFRQLLIDEIEPFSPTFLFTDHFKVDGLFDPADPLNDPRFDVETWMYVLKPFEVTTLQPVKKVIFIHSDKSRTVTVFEEVTTTEWRLVPVHGMAEDIPFDVDPTIPQISFDSILQIQQVPEPRSSLLLAVASLGLIVIARRRDRLTRRRKRRSGRDPVGRSTPA